ncbi:hypothetical protein Dimus_007325 [Dionaea muscipula]
MEDRRDWALRQLGLPARRRSPSPRPPMISRDPPSPRLGTELTPVKDYLDTSEEDSIEDEGLSEDAEIPIEVVGSTSLVSEGSIGATEGPVKVPEGSVHRGPHAPGGSMSVEASPSLGVLPRPEGVDEDGPLGGPARLVRPPSFGGQQHWPPLSTAAASQVAGVANPVGGSTDVVGVGGGQCSFASVLGGNRRADAPFRWLVVVDRGWR